MSSYSHKFVEVHCFIKSLTQKRIRLKLPSPDDWAINLNSILKRIPKKFNLLASFDESEWLLTINDIIIDKQEPIKFGELLSNDIAPPAIIKIIRSPSNQWMSFKAEETNNECYLKINNKSVSMTWKPSNIRMGDWDNNYNDLIKKITEKFEINEDDFELQDNDECEIIDGDDLKVIWHSLINNKSVHVEDIKIICDDGTKTEISDMNDATDAIINDMKWDEIFSLQSMLIDVNDFNSEAIETTDFAMNWSKACNGINHEMWPVLANAVRAIIKDKKIDQNDLSVDCIKNVITILKEERH